MFREMRRKDKELSAEETIEILNAGEVGVLATSDRDNLPYAVPLNYVYHNGCIYFHCAVEGQKIDNMEHNPKVSFCVVKDARLVPRQFTTKFKSAIVFGAAEEALGEEKIQALWALIHRFSSEHLEAGEKYIKNVLDKTRVFKIKIEHVSGKGTS